MPSHKSRCFIPLSSLPFLDPFFVGSTEEPHYASGKKSYLACKDHFQFFKTLLYPRSSWINRFIQDSLYLGGRYN